MSLETIARHYYPRLTRYGLRLGSWRARVQDNGIEVTRSEDGMFITRGYYIDLRALRIIRTF